MPKIKNTIMAFMGKSKTSTTLLGSWRRIVLFTTAVILVNWLIGASGYFLYQWYQSSTSQPDHSEPDHSEQVLTDGSQDGRYWAQKIASGDGAYILYFRHAEREKWPLVAVYDYFEVSESLDGSLQSFAAAVCLSERGKADASLIGRVFDTADIPVARVLSSPSCRAKETASLAFGRIDVTDRAILAGTAVGVSLEREIYASNLLDLLVQNSPEDGERLVVVGHADTLDFHAAELFPGFAREIPTVNESGFYLIEVVDGKMVPRWAFLDLYDFARELLVY